jgi:hypothetical protein
MSTQLETAIIGLIISNLGTLGALLFVARRVAAPKPKPQPRNGSGTGGTSPGSSM